MVDTIADLKSQINSLHNRVVEERNVRLEDEARANRQFEQMSYRIGELDNERTYLRDENTRLMVDMAGRGVELSKREDLMMIAEKKMKEREEESEDFRVRRGDMIEKEVSERMKKNMTRFQELEIDLEKHKRLKKELTDRLDAAYDEVKYKTDKIKALESRVRALERHEDDMNEKILDYIDENADLKRKMIEMNIEEEPKKVKDREKNEK